MLKCLARCLASGRYSGKKIKKEFLVPFPRASGPLIIIKVIRKFISFSRTKP